MKIELKERTKENVIEYFEKSHDPEIQRFLPQKAKTLSEALADYEKTKLPDANSFGLTVYADGVYVGDVWCYCIDKNEVPNAMLSYCIFEKSYRGKGVASAAVFEFIKVIETRFLLKSIGAFVFAENLASVRVLEKNGFLLMEEFFEKDERSFYFQKDLCNRD